MMDHDGVRWSVRTGEHCIRCDEPTGNAGESDDSLYGENGVGPYCDSCFELVEQITHLTAERDAALAGKAEAERLAVWVMDRRPGLVFGPGYGRLEWMDDENGVMSVDCDGTDESILRALREAAAMEGGRDGD